MSDELSAYIQNQRQAGFTDQQIRQALLDAGHTIDVVDALFGGVTREAVTPELNMSEEVARELKPAKSGRRWLKWVLAVIGLIVLAISALFLLSRLLPADGDAIKNRALNTLMDKGEEVFMENGQVTTNGLCAFMIFNQSYLEAVSNPAWEFQCFDSDTAFAGEVRLNDGTYRCQDSAGNDMRADRSLIYGPECLEATDSRLNDDETFSTTYVFFDSPRVEVESGAKSQQSIDDIIDEWDAKTDYACGVFTRRTEEPNDINNNGQECLGQAIIDGCELTAYKTINSINTENIYFVYTDNDICKMGYAHHGGAIRSGECDVVKVLNSGIRSTFPMDEDLEYWVDREGNRIYEKAYREISQEYYTRDMSEKEILSETGCQFYE